MHRLDATRGKVLHRTRRPARLLALALVWMACEALAGCAAITNPVADGIPVRRVPPEYLGKPRNALVPISYTCLEPPPPDAYRLAPGDVLGVWIEGILGERGAIMPVTLTSPATLRDPQRLPPVVGYPIPVRDDGTIALPMADPLRVQGLTLMEVQEAIRQLYTVRRKILAVGNERILVSLMQPRTYQVLVLRQEATTFASGPTGIGLTTTSKTGNGAIVDLPAYQNDVLHALAQTGGLPGQDAYDAVIVQHGCFRDAASREMLRQQFEAAAANHLPLPTGGPNKVVRVPLRIKPGDPVPLRPEDVTLQTGDVVFLEARDKEIFFTGGLLPSGEHVLPRDHDLDVVEAVARVRGPLINGAFANNNLSGNLILAGIGFDNPSLLTVVRRLPAGGVLPIRVDLNVALRDQRERILVQPGDLLILQEKPDDALARYLGQTVFNFSMSWEALHDRFIQGVFDANAPSQLSSNRIGVFQTTNINTSR
jgi:protein involved in polysaccharide export with SLBB domain